MSDKTFTTADGLFTVELTRCTNRVEFEVSEISCVGDKPDIRGWVKSDGCMDWTTCDSYFHFCNVGSIDSFAWLFREIRTMCIDLGCTNMDIIAD